MRKCWNSLFVLLVLFLVSTDIVECFRVLVGTKRNGSYPRPYDKLPNAFVGIYGDARNYQRERINEGSLETADKELLYEDVSPRQSCPGMVGPFSDGSYYCGAREFGYCDRRSGTCFCNTGYTGIDCGQCQDSHYRVGPHCYPKKLCPDDCSGAGTCNYNNGTCTCQPHRRGERCETLLCSIHSPLCVSCTADTCLQCSGGYYLTGDSEVCSTCYDFDPRCAGCIKEVGCTVCADSTLTSVRRSGYRKADRALPEEEITREFSITLPFGTKSAESFAEAESYFVASTADKPLNNASMSCSQGLNNDSSWSCVPFPQSHIVCGHYGVFKFTYPNYAVREDSNYIRLYVQRSGGGYGDVTINYYIKHFTTNDSDVVATAPYTTIQQLHFAQGVVEKSFLVTILDDNIVEENEVFQVILETPEGGGSVGAQFRTNVTIIDDDLYKTSPTMSYLFVSTTNGTISRDITSARAGEDIVIYIQAVLPTDEVQAIDSDRYIAYIENSMSTSSQRSMNRIYMNVTNLGNGLYAAVASGGLPTQGAFDIHVYYAMPNSIQGEYYYDAWFDQLAVRRVDHNVNFTWGAGRLIPRGNDFVSIRWRGGIIIDAAGIYSFALDADDIGRLWVDGTLLLDHTHERNLQSQGPRSIYLAEGVVEIVIEYVEMNGDAHARLLYALEGEELEVVPQPKLATLYPIGNSPFKVDVRSSFTSHLTTEVTGDGLSVATTLTPQTFEICPRDMYGNLRNDELDAHTLYFDQFEAVMQHESQPEVIIRPHLMYNPTTHCWDGIYTMYTAGNYQLNITFNDMVTYSANGEKNEYFHVFGSPYAVHVSPSAPSGPLSEIVGIPAQPIYIEAGQCIDFMVNLKDGAGNYVEVGGDVVSAYMFRVDYHNITAGIQPNSDSFFSSGEVNPTQMPSRTPTQRPTTFDEAFDYSYPPRVADTYLQVDVIRYGEVTDLQNGSYAVFICPVIAGRYELHVLLRGAGVSNQVLRTMDRFHSGLISSGEGVYRGVYIGSSPYDVEVYHTVASAITSQVVGDGLSVGTTGVPSYVMLTLRDPYDNVFVNQFLTTMEHYTYPAANITFSIDQTPGIYREIWDYTNGSFLLKFIPQLLGRQTLSIYINGGHIFGSPFELFISSGEVNATTSIAVGEGLHTGTTGIESYFYVFAYDQYGNRRVGKDNFTFEYRNGDELITGNLQPCLYPPVDHSCPSLTGQETGYYYGVFTPTLRGEGQLSIYQIDEQGLANEISESPFQVAVASSRPKATFTDIEGNLYSKEAGTIGRVDLQLRDYFRNKLTFGGYQVELEMIGVAGEWGTVLPYSDNQSFPNTYNYKSFFVYPTYSGLGYVDHGDGQYSLFYNVTQVGQYVMRLGLQEEGLNATFFNDTQFGYLVDHVDLYPTFRSGGEVLFKETFINSFHGQPVSYFDGTRHWTGDLGGPLANTSQGDNSFYHKYASIRAPSLLIRPRDYLQLPGKVIAEGIDGISAATNFRQHFYSILYTGYLQPRTIELYRLHLQLDDQSEVRCYLNHSLVLNSTVGRPMTEAMYNFSSLEALPLRIEFIHYNGEAFMEWYWESISVPLEAIPPSAFTHSVNISHFNTTIFPTAHCPSCSTAYGALTEATVGYDHWIYVYTRDRFGNLLQETRGLRVYLYALHVDGVVMRGSVRDFGNSTYELRYYPTRSGIYELYLYSYAGMPPDDSIGPAAFLRAIGPHLITGSPYRLVVSSDNLFIEKSAAIGRGVVGGIAGDVLPLSIAFVDRFRNPTVAETVTPRVTITSNATGQVVLPSTLTFNLSSAQLQCHYAVTRADVYQLHVELSTADGLFKHVLGSPFVISIAPATPSPPHIYVKGMGMRQAVANVTSSVYIQARDQFSNDLAIGGYKWFVRLVGDANFSAARLDAVPSCIDLRDGTYHCTYTPQYAGQHHLEVKLLRPVYRYTNTFEGRPGGGGLTARYYGSVDGADAGAMDIISTRIDPVMQFFWPNGHIVGNSVEYLLTGQSVRWEGFLIAPRSDRFRLRADSNLNVTIYLDRQVVYDSRHGGSVPISLTHDSSYALVITATTQPGFSENAFLRLLWRTDIYREQLVSQFFLYDSAEEVKFSPFPVTVLEAAT